MDLRPYYDTLRRTSLLRGMRDDELDNMMRCFNPGCGATRRESSCCWPATKTTRWALCWRAASPR